jgi:hypothetical protein
MPKRTMVIRGPVLTYTGDPFKSSLDDTLVYESDAIVAMADGAITHLVQLTGFFHNCLPVLRSRTTARIR